jgi:hypothetical protein
LVDILHSQVIQVTLVFHCIISDRHYFFSVYFEVWNVVLNMSYVGETSDNFLRHDVTKGVDCYPWISYMYLQYIFQLCCFFAFLLYMPLVNKQWTLWMMKTVRLKPHQLLIILVINEVVTAVFSRCGTLLYECMFDVYVVSLKCFD